MEDIVIERIALDRSQMRVTLSGLPDSPGLAADVFRKIAEKSVVVDMIVRVAAIRSGSRRSVSPSRAKTFRPSSSLAEEFKAAFGCRVNQDPAVAEADRARHRAANHTDLALRMFETFSRAKINVSIIGTSERSVNVVIDDADGDEGFKLLKREFSAELA